VDWDVGDVLEDTCHKYRDLKQSPPAPDVSAATHASRPVTAPNASHVHRGDIHFGIAT
jgi:hypothetical protein